MLKNTIHKILSNFFVIYACFLYKFIFSDDYKPSTSKNNKVLNIGSTIEGNILKADVYDTYELNITKDQVNKGSTLQLTVKPLGDYTRFSDPDLYVSKQDKPTRLSNEWMSEHFGMDIILIDLSKLNKDGDKLYVSVTCEFGNCPYNLYAQIDNIVNIPLNVEIQLILNRNQMPIFKVPFNKTITDEDGTTKKIKRIQASIWSTSLTGFKAILKIDGKKNSNINLSAAWLGAESAIIEDENLCDSCNYNLLIYPDSEVSVLYFKFATSIDFFEFTQDNLAFGMTKGYETTCYRKMIKKKDTNIILSMTLYSGSGYLDLYSNDKTPFQSENSLVHKEINSEYVEAFAKSKLNIKDEGNLYLCFTSNYATSTYSYTVYDESEAENQQLNNIIYNGIPVSAYLPLNEATQLSIIDAQKNEEIIVNIEVQKGNPEFYGSLSKNFKFVNKKFIDINKSSLIPSSKDSSGKISVTISSSENICGIEHSKFNCLPIIIAYCPDEECIFSLTGNYGHKTIQLKDKQLYQKIVPYGSVDYYYFNINEDVDSIIIILNIISGEANLYASQTEVKPSTSSYKWFSPHEIFTPDLIKIEKDNFNKDLTGKYYLSVIPESYTAYSIMYYTKSLKENKDHEEKNKEPIFVSFGLISGVPFSGYIESDQLYIIYSFDVKEEKSVRFVLTPEKGSTEMYVFTNNSFRSKFNKDAGDSEDKFTGYQYKTNDYPEIIITDNDPFYLKNTTYYAVVARKSTINNDKVKERFSFNILVNVNDDPILLFDNIPQMITLVSNSYPKQKFIVYVDKDNKDKYVAINTYNNIYPIKIDAGKNSTINCSSYCQLPVNELSCSQNNSKSTTDNNNLDTCESVFTVDIDSNIFTSLEISIKTVNSTISGELLNYGTDKIVVSNGNSTSNYYMYVDYEKSEMDIYFNVIKGYGKILIKVIKSDDTKNAEYPKGNDDDNKDQYIKPRHTLGYSMKALYIKDDILPVCNKLYNIDEDSNNNASCIMLFTFVPDKNDEFYVNIQYSGIQSFISTDDPIKVSIDQSKIIDYYFTIPEGIDKFSVSLSHIIGDEIFVGLNKDVKGHEDKYDYHYSSFNSYKQLIIHKDNLPFRLNNTNNTDISGKYFMTITSQNTTKFELYINTHPIDMKLVTDYSITECTALKGESCYFFYYLNDDYFNYFSEYDDFDALDQKNNNITLLSYAEFIYGDGNIYANIVNKTLDIHEWNIPQSNDLVNIASTNIDNALKIVYNSNNQLSFDNSVVLYNLVCTTDCHIKFKTKALRNNTFEYMNENEDNIIFVGSNSTSFAKLFSNKSNYSFKFNVLNGQGKATLYKKASFWNDANSNSEEETYIESIMLYDIHKSSFFNVYDLQKDMIIEIKIENFSNQDDLALIINVSEPTSFDNIIANNTEVHSQHWQPLNIKYPNVILSSSPIANKQVHKYYIRYIDQYDMISVNLKSDVIFNKIELIGEFYTYKSDKEKTLEIQLDEFNILKDFDTNKYDNGFNYDIRYYSSSSAYMNITKNNDIDYINNQVYFVLVVKAVLHSDPAEVKNELNKYNSLLNSGVALFTIDLNFKESDEDKKPISSFKLNADSQVYDKCYKNWPTLYKINNNYSKSSRSQKDTNIIKITFCKESYKNEDFNLEIYNDKKLSTNLEYNIISNAPNFIALYNTKFSNINYIKLDTQRDISYFIEYNNDYSKLVNSKLINYEFEIEYKIYSDENIIELNWKPIPANFYSYSIYVYDIKDKAPHGICDLTEVTAFVQHTNNGNFNIDLKDITYNSAIITQVVHIQGNMYKYNNIYIDSNNINKVEKMSWIVICKLSLNYYIMFNY